MEKLEKDREVDIVKNTEQGELLLAPKAESKIEKEIEKLDLDNLTPVEALQKLIELKNKLK